MSREPSNALTYASSDGNIHVALIPAKVEDVMKAYRKGAIGALVDEYERAASELKLLLEDIPEDEFVKIIDTETKDDDCRSVQTIITHVVAAGYAYADYIRKAIDIQSTIPNRKLLSRLDARPELDTMLKYTAHTFEGRWEMSDDEMSGIAIHSRWGVTYDLEQLLEHAIVHILRHRRQIERLLGERAYLHRASDNLVLQP